MYKQCLPTLVYNTVHNYYHDSLSLISAWFLNNFISGDKLPICCGCGGTGTLINPPRYEKGKVVFIQLNQLCPNILYLLLVVDG